MKRKNAVIYVMTAVLLAVAVFFAVEAAGPFFFRLPTAQGAETIQVVKRGSEHYVFLPGWADLAELQLQTLRSVRLDGVKIRKTCENLEPNRPYALHFGSEEGTLTFLQSENIPTLFLDTASGDMDYVHREKGNKAPGYLRLYGPDGTLDTGENLNFIKARGNSTFTYAAKKAYSLEMSQAADLLGMGWAQKWILLTERNELHPSRVNVPGPTFLVSSEAPERMEEQNLPHITLDSGTTLRIHESDFDPQELQNLWTSAENAILSQDGIDPATGKHWSELIDLDSWARKYLIEEIFANHDGGCLSQFYYLSGGKICAGPVWDYDYAMANRAIYEAPAPNMLYVNQPYERHGGLWFSKLYRDEKFHSTVINLYETQFSPLLQKLTETGLPNYQATAARAARLDAMLWAEDDSMAEMTAIETYLPRRLDFLNQIWIEDEPYFQVTADCQGRWANYAVFPGDYLPELPQREGCDWYHTGTDALFDPYQPILEETAIELREIW